MEIINRRNFILKTAIISGVGMATIPHFSFPKMAGGNAYGEHPSSQSTRFIAAYDTESKACVENLETIVNMHQKYKIPATFFIVSSILNKGNIGMVKELLDEPLFEIASHSSSHSVVLDHAVCGKAGDTRKEIVDSKKVLEDVFGKDVLGFRTPCGYSEGLRGEKKILELVDEAGYKYISTMLWGPGFSLPADIVEAFSYEEEGFKDILEIPGHGWHENVLKGHSKVSIPLVVWPSTWPEIAIPKAYIKSPMEEFQINKYFIETAKEENKEHITFIWHPWSLARFDSKMDMLDLTFSYINKTKCKTDTFEGFYKEKTNKV